MTYALSPALQSAVYAELVADPGLTSILGTDIYDALPPGVLPSIYALIGPETVRDRSDMTGRGADHDFTVSIVTDGAGFATAKAAAGAVSDALNGADLGLSRGRLVGLRFVKATAARRGSGEQRQITLTFRARVEDS